MKNMLQAGRMDKLSQMLLTEQTRWGLRLTIGLSSVGTIGVLVMSGFSSMVRMRMRLNFKGVRKQELDKVSIDSCLRSSAFKLEEKGWWQWRNHCQGFLKKQ